MRILIWSFVPPDPESAYWFWLKQGMEDVGHQVIAVDAYALTALFGVRTMQEILLTYADAFQVQVAMVVPQNFVETWFLEALRARGIAVVALRYDDGLVFAEGQDSMPLTHLDLIGYADPYCDVSVTICRRAVSGFAAHALKAPVYLPFPYNWQSVPLVERSVRPVIAFAGSPKYREGAPLSARVAVVKALAAARLPVEAHHAEWARVPGCEAVARPTPSLAAFHDVFRTSRVNIVVTADWGAACYRMIKQLSLEIAATGAMQIASPSEELADLFAIGEDVAVADSIDGFVSQARHYLAHPDEARRMGLSSRRSLERHGGWHGWWHQVAGLLAEKGKPLDVAAGPIAPEQAAHPMLVMAATALAHAYEAQGDMVLAGVYFREVLGYRPDDYSALAGLARQAGTLPAARPLWRQASMAVSRTQGVHLERRLHMPGIGADGTQFSRMAASRWCLLALSEGDYGDALAALPPLCRIDPKVGEDTLNFFLQRQEWSWARRTLDVYLRFWPADVVALRKRAELAAGQGDYQQANMDIARATLLEQRQL